MTAPGTRRHIYDTKLGTDKCDNSSMSLQMGYTQGANQSGQVFGLGRQIYDPKYCPQGTVADGAPSGAGDCPDPGGGPRISPLLPGGGRLLRLPARSLPTSSPRLGFWVFLCFQLSSLWFLCKFQEVFTKEKYILFFIPEEWGRDSGEGAGKSVTWERGPGHDAKYLQLPSDWISPGPTDLRPSDLPRGQVGKVKDVQGSEILSCWAKPDPLSMLPPPTHSGLSRFCFSCGCHPGWSAVARSRLTAPPPPGLKRFSSLSPPSSWDCRCSTTPG